MSKFHYIIGVYLLCVVPASNGDICSTCVCSNTDAGPVVNCHDKRLESNDVLNSELLMMDEHRTLNELILSRNNITYLPGNILKKLKRMKSLDLSENSMEEMHPAVFAGLDNLQDLNLSKNKLKAFDDVSLQTLPTLQKLYLGHNNIGTIEHTFNNKAENVTFLDLSHNSITKLNGPFFESVPNLEYLDLSFNHLASIDENSLAGLSSLKIVFVNANRLTSLDAKEFPNSLLELHCGFNLINTISYESGKIEVLNIEHNRISTVSEDIANLNRLQRLNISGNQVSEFPPVYLEQLRTLDLSNNKFTEVPMSLSTKTLPRLANLNISRNPIRDLRFPTELRLHSLVVNDNNMLESIQEHAFKNLNSPPGKCMNLTISGNPILHYVHEAAIKHINVCYLDLSYNSISGLSQNLLSLDSDFVNYTVNLQGNPFNCECSLQWMVNVLVPKLFTTRPSLLDDLRCSSPPQISNTRMVHWYKWKNEIFCMDMSDRLETMPAEVTARSSFVMIKSSPGFLIAIAVSVALLVVSIAGGIVLTWRISLRKRRVNRRF